MIELKSNYREDMACQMYGVAGLLILPFSVWAMSKGMGWSGVPSAVTALVCLINFLYYRRLKRFLLPPIAVSLLFVADNVLAIYELGPAGAFWSYPTMLAFYWIHPRKQALKIVPLLYVSVCFSGILFLPIEYTIRIAVTLLMMGIFFHIAVGLIERQYQDVKHLSVTDHLTSAYNRRYMDRKIEELIERQHRTAIKAAMVTLDVDYFKAINDHFGHSSGDKVLIEIVKLLRARVRVLDKVCRSGGEEFVILLPDTGEQAAYTLAEDLRHAISESHFLTETKITISCGIASLKPGDSRDSWLKRSDQALYQAKESGRNTVVVGPANSQEAFV